MNADLAIQHKAQGRFVSVQNHQTFVYEKGNGDAVVCFHGVPSSSFLYRKIIDGLAQQHARGLSFDFVGMGLSDRPKDYNYTWTGLGNWSYELIQQLDLGKFHVVLHDIGGPVGCEVIAKMPEQILSVTILNTPLVNLPQFKKPFPMYFFPLRGIGALFLATTTPFLFQQLMHMRGIDKKEAFGRSEAKAWVELLKGNDGGEAFLQIMRGFEPTSEKEALYLRALNDLDVPKQIIWGANDPGLSLEQYGIPLQKALNLPKITETRGSHFLQEDYAAEVTEKIVEIIQ